MPPFKQPNPERPDPGGLGRELVKQIGNLALFTIENVPPEHRPEARRLALQVLAAARAYSRSNFADFKEYVEKVEREKVEREYPHVFWRRN